MYEQEEVISNDKLEGLASELAKTFSIDTDEAMSLIYEEWELVESLFHSHSSIKTVYANFMDEINYAYRIA